MLLDITITFFKGKEPLWKEYDTLISSLITIFLFVAAYFINQWIESKKNKKKLNEKLNYLTSIIISSLKIIKKQREKIEENVLNFTHRDKYTLNPVPVFSFLEITRVTDKLDLESYYLSYISKYGNTPEIINEFQVLIQTFDFLNEFHKSFHKLLERGGNNHESRLLKFNPLSQRIDTMVVEVRDYLFVNKSIHLKLFDKVLTQYYIDKNDFLDYQITFFEKTFLIPMNKLFQEIRLNEDSNLLFHFNILLQEISNEIRYINAGLKSFYIDINNNVNELLSSEKKLTNYSLRLRTDLLKLVE